jgi:hypothetical protein
MVTVHQVSEKSVVDGLKLARMQFGNCLEVIGSEKFIEQTIQVLANDKELADIRLANLVHQQRLEETKIKILEATQHEMSAVEKAKIWLSNKEQSKHDPVQNKQLDNNIDKQSNLSTVEKAKQLLENRQIRSTEEIAKELAQNKEMNTEPKVITKVQEQLKEKELVQERLPELSKNRGMER